jgi:glycosyltransferase involved in cell wall biosynthesis
MEQFISNALDLGHELWVYPGNKFPGLNTIPTNRFNHIKTMHKMDVLYVRVESSFPEICTWSLPPRRNLYGFPVVVWEFNTTPERSLFRGRSEKHVEKTVKSFRHYGRGCDLAICMTDSLAEYVQRNFGIERILIVPNGSDPDLFRTDAPIVKRMIPYQDKFNIVWMGSGKEPWHDLKMLGEAAQIVWENDSDMDMIFHIIGPDLEGLMAGMPHNVFYWGAEYYKKLPNWLTCMDVGLSLFHTGPADVATPLKVFDYMASGLTVVSTPMSFMIDLFDELGQSDLIVPSGDSETLAMKLIDLVSDQERVHRLGLAGRQLVIDRYNWRRAVQDTMDEMEAILRDRKKTKPVNR